MDSESEPSDTEYDGAAGRSDFAGERGEVGKEQDRCERFCRGEPHLTPCDWEHYLEMSHQVPD